jgi:hypothetical protein
MIEAGSMSAQGKHAIIGFANPMIDIERICQEHSEEEKPPEVFLLSSGSIDNSLLAARMEFL